MGTDLGSREMSELSLLLKAPLHRYRTPFLLWLLLLAGSFYWLHIIQHHQQHEHFFQHAQQLHSKTDHAITSNEIILKLLASQIGPKELFEQQHLASLVQQLTIGKEQIAGVLLFPTLHADQMPLLTTLTKTHLNPQFSLQADEADQLLSPILYYYPNTQEAPSLDFVNARTLTSLESTIHATQDGNTLHSRPFLLGNEHYYLLITQAKREINSEDEPYPWYTNLHVALLIKPQTLLTPAPQVHSTLSLFNPSSGEHQILSSSSASDQEEGVRLEYRAHLNSTSQPFLLSISTTTPYLQIGAIHLLLLLITSLLFFWVAHRRIVHAQAAWEQQQLNAKRLLINTKNRVQMLNAISHDLRTPLTRLQLRATTFLHGKSRDKTIADLKEITSLVETSLNYLRGEEQNEEPQLTDINELVFTLQMEMSEQQKLFTTHGRARWPYLCQQLQLKRAIQNLLNNAFRYATTVEIELHDQVHHLAIEVRDNGPGIESELLEKVTHPYFRAEDSRNRESGGIGLGLAIVQEIAESHDGGLHLKNREKGGLQVTLSLPR